MLHLVAETDIVLLINNMLPSKTILLPILAQVLRLGWGLPFWRLIFFFDVFLLFSHAFVVASLFLVRQSAHFLYSCWPGSSGGRVFLQDGLEHCLGRVSIVDSKSSS